MIEQKQESAKINIFQLLEEQVQPRLILIKKYFYIPLILAVIAFGFTYLSERSKKPTFNAKITFLLEDELLGETGKMASANPVLMALGGQSNNNNKAIMVDLATSNKLIEQSLLQKVEIDKKPVILINYYFDQMGYRDNWKKTDNQKWLTKLYPVDYKIGTDNDMDYMLRAVSNEIKLVLVPKVLESGLIAMTYSSQSENVTKYFLETHLKTISNFYINKKVERAQGLVEFAKKKRDSLLSLLSGKTYGLANMQDQVFGAVMKRSMVRQVQTQTDIEILNKQYAESVGALSAASIDLERRRPFISVIDDIRVPLDSKWPNPMKKAITLAIVMFILGLAGIIGVFLGWDILKKQKREFLDSTTQ